MREVSWIKAARKDFEDFPEPVRKAVANSLALVAVGAMPAYPSH